MTRFYDLDLGLDDWQIGLLMSLGAVVVLFTQPLWGYCSDKILGRTPAFRLVLLLAAGFFIFYSFAYPIGGYPLLLLATLLMMSCYSSTTPLNSALILSFLDHDRRDYFGRIRAFGSLSFMLTMFLICPLLVHYSEVFNMPGRVFVFFGASGFYLLSLLCTLWDDSQFGQNHRPELRSFAALFNNPKILILYLSIYLTSIGASAGIQYIGPYIGYRGFSEYYYSSLWLIGVGVEVVITFSLHTIVRRIGLKKTIALGLASEGLRWTGIWFFEAPIMIQMFYGLHGFTVIGLFFASAMFIDSQCEASIRSTAQSMLFFSIVFGKVTGFIGGSLLVRLYSDLPRADAIQSSFFWYGIAAFVGAFIFAAFVPRDPKFTPPANE